MDFPFRFGVEEEFFVVDRSTLEARAVMPPALWAAIERRVPRVSKELLQAQVELQTEPCASIRDCLDQLNEGRARLGEVLAEDGAGFMASGTHPTMDWRDAMRSPGARYAGLVRDMRMLAHRNMYCGLHVHVETPKDVSRIALIDRCTPFLPLFLALSVSSPFWMGLWTGMCGYRLTGYDELPRTGLPPGLADEAAYAAYVATLKRAGAIKDATYIWWTVRPSAKYPTVELRICDSVPDVRHAAAIAALFRCLVRRLARDPGYGPAPSPLLRAVADENRWQVQCDGVHATVIDPFTLEPAAATDLILLLCADLRADAEALRCADGLDGVAAILKEGPSADRQIALLQSELDAGRGLDAALDKIKRWLARVSAAEATAAAD